MAVLLLQWPVLPHGLPSRKAWCALGFSAQVAAKRPSAVTKGAASSTSRAAASGASVTASATCKPESRRNLKPTKPAPIQISDADRKRNILITDKCTMAFKKWRKKAILSGWIGTGALKVAVYIKLCPQVLSTVRVRSIGV